MLKCPEMFLAKKYLPASSLPAATKLKCEPGTVIIPSSETLAFDPFRKNDSLVLTGFRPGFASAEVRISSKRLIVLQQSYYTGWKLFIDHKEAPIVKVNGLVVGGWIPGGIHNIEFKYSNPPVLAGFLFQSGLFLLLAWVCCVGFSYSNRKDNKNQARKELSKTLEDSLRVKKLTALAYYYFDYLGDGKLADSLSDEAIRISELSFRPAFRLNAYLSYFDNNEFVQINVRRKSHEFH